MTRLLTNGLPPSLPTPFLQECCKATQGGPISQSLCLSPRKGGISPYYPTARHDAYPPDPRHLPYPAYSQPPHTAWAHRLGTFPKLSALLGRFRGGCCPPSQ